MAKGETLFWFPRLYNYMVVYKAMQQFTTERERERERGERERQERERGERDREADRQTE